ncbi:MAG: DNA cytosine methyltransferase [Hyphomonadaceae bacterium]|nr:DNA cytosine methyltransferase [Hyphomonadaceae bacterium]
MPTFFEFFAGGGMVRAGLGGRWSCALANDFDRKKAETYRLNHLKDGGADILCDDINNITREQLPNTPHLVWASFPCQDLSLAGGGAGLRGDRSGTFWPFWQRMEWLSERGPLPNFIVLENVCGTLTSHDGRDFRSIVTAFSKLGMRVGAMVIDAERFVPQSRPRLFFVGVSATDSLPSRLVSDGPHDVWHPAPLKRAFMRLDPAEKEAWIWWNMPLPQKRSKRFADLLEEDPSDVTWHSREETRKLLSMMAMPHKKKVEQAKRAGRVMVGAIYKRTRLSTDDEKVQRAEIRFDDVAGCLRTPAGGSSRQTLMIVDGTEVRSRLISARETARLMGLSDDYVLPERYNEAYHLTGDGVVVPVVGHLSNSIFLPALGKATGAISELHPVQVRRRASRKS